MLLSNIALLLCHQMLGDMLDSSGQCEQVFDQVGNAVLGCLDGVLALGFSLQISFAWVISVTLKG